MADQQDPQLLSSFNTEAITSLRGAIDPESVSAVSKEILVRAQQYPTLRNLLGDKNIKQKIGEALVKNDPELLRGVLLDIFGEARTFERQQMTELPAGEPFANETTATTPKLTTKEYVARMSETESASQLVIEQRKMARRHRFAEDLTNNFIKQTRQTITEEQKQTEINRVERDLSTPDWYNNKEQITNTVGQSFFGGPIYQDAVDKTAKIAIAEAGRVARDEEQFETTIASVASSIAADEIAVQRPDVFIKIAADQAGRSTNAPVDKIIGRAAALENATAGFTGGGPALPQSLSLLATNPLQKIVAGAIDRLPTGLREAVIANLANSAWEKAVDAATRYYGRQVVNEPWFQQALANGNAGLASGKGALQSLINGPYKFLGDVATTVFRGSFDEATIAYVETVRLNITAVPMITYQQFYTATVYSHNPGLLSYGINLGLQYGTRKATQALIKAGVKKAAVGTTVKLGVEAVAGVATGGWGWVAAAGLSVLNWLKDRGSALLRGIFFMGTSPNPEDNLLLVVGAGVVLVFFLPLFPLLNLPAFNQSMIDTSLATSVGGGIGEGPGINCQITPDDPQCKFTPCVGDCRWPTSGYITQGPRTAQFCSPSANPTHGSGSASSQNAIDFSSMGGGAVYATKVGTVQRIFSGCPESGASIDPWCGGGPDRTNPGDGAHPDYAGYGNHVVLLTDNGYTIIFGHLKSAIGVRYGQKITDPNTQIGWVDNSGHSFGTHLHFGVLSGGNVLDLIPTKDPALTPAAIDGCIQQTPGCTKVCPTTPVTAGS